MASPIKGLIITPAGDYNALSLKPVRHDALPVDDEKTSLDNNVNLDDGVKNKLVEGAAWWARVSLMRKR